MKINPSSDIIYSLYVNIGGKIIMKILRAIGAFFAKIGRWIANTAWVQPLLIVGGIFAIIFSIPYIKKGFEGLFNDDTDTDYEWYKGQALGLEENGAADKLLGYLENYSKDAEKIRTEFAPKFVLAFVQQDCQNCKDSVEGYVNAINSGYVPGMRIYTILVDQMDSAGKTYLAKDIYGKHTGLFEDLVEAYGEDGKEDYPLYRNLITKGDSTKVDSLMEKSAGLDEASTSEAGLQTPLTMVVDLDKFDAGYYGIDGVTQLFYNYNDFDDSSATSAASKGQVVRDFWNYEGLFDPEYSK